VEDPLVWMQKEKKEKKYKRKRSDPCAPLLPCLFLLILFMLLYQLVIDLVKYYTVRLFLVCPSGNMYLEVDQ